MEKIQMQVTGMDCTNCALSIQKYLTKQGLEDVKVNFVTGEVSFLPAENTSIPTIKKGIHSLGYEVVDNSTQTLKKKNKFLSNNLQRFWFCLVFTLPLALHMVGLHVHWLMNEWVQFGLTLPVYIVGMWVFGKSAVNSVLKGVPNMNVLISIGSTAALVYSLYGAFTGRAEEFMFFETTATIITLVFMGNWLEDKSIEVTQAALNKLATEQKIMANMIAYDDAHNENVFQVESDTLRVGDLILIKTGETVPMDCKILWGEVSVNEAIITGESTPVFKKINDILIGGSIVDNGTVKAYVSATGENAVLGNILKMVREAQTEKPPIQQLADKISVIFVPAVVAIALLTVIVNYWVVDKTFTDSLLRGIAVLVIACPCAMGLATPAAIAVGLGRAANNGVLFKNARSLEIFKNIQKVVFDKTGTLTTGNFSLREWHSNLEEDAFKRVAFSLEKYSNHPIARCISTAFKTKNDIRWASLEEVKGKGITATDKEGNIYKAGSLSFIGLAAEEGHNVYFTCNNALIGWIDVHDEIRVEAKQVIDYLKSRQIETILLSGDTHAKCLQVANAIGIDTIIAEQTPEQKLAYITELTKNYATAMVGDGINDAPALAKATVGISLSEASQVAMQSAQVILLNHGLKNLPLSLGLGKHTYLTIKQNLFWAFSYNIVAIPVAALGFLNPTVGALVMGLSDVVLAINSVRLKWKKVM